MSCTLTFRPHSKNMILKILYYLGRECPSTEQHKYCYGILDKMDNICSEYRADRYKQLFCVQGYLETPIEIETDVFVWTEYMDPNNKLYEMEKFTHDCPFLLHLKGKSYPQLETFLLKVLDRYSKEISNPDGENNASGKISVFHWRDSDLYWENCNQLVERSIQSIYLPKQQTQDVLHDVLHFISSPVKEMYMRFGIPYRKTYCFHGPPGTGKTSLIHAIASEIQRGISVFRFHSNTKEVDFLDAVRHIPKKTIFAIEDFDCFFQQRDKQSSSASGLGFSAILNFLDGLSSNEGQIIFLTTNCIETIDPALKRPGRMDYILKFSYLTREQLQQMFLVFCPSQQSKIDLVFQKLRGLNMTVCHVQKFLFSFVTSNDRTLEDSLDSFLTEYQTFYSTENPNTRHLYS